MITTKNRALCTGGILAYLGLGWTEHFFSHDYGGGDRCWRRGCTADWGLWASSESEASR